MGKIGEGGQKVQTSGYKTVSHSDVLHSIGNRVNNTISLYGDKWLLDL